MTSRHPASQAFHDACDAMKAMHDKKQKDYGREGDPFSNVRASEDFGIAGWVGCLVRANDKMRRLQKAAQGAALANEGVEDSLMDLAVYSIIGLVLYREEQEKAQRAANVAAIAYTVEKFKEVNFEAEPYNPRGHFEQQENGEVWWIPSGRTADDLRAETQRWDRP
jgi:hypothetical protein